MKLNTVIVLGILVLAPVQVVTNSTQVIRAYNAVGDWMCDGDWTETSLVRRREFLGECDVDPFAAYVND